MTLHRLHCLRGDYDALLISSGRFVRRRLLDLLRMRARRLIALDGGVNLLYRFRTVPDDVIGDMDSASPEALQWARRRGARVHHRPSTEEPDFAKALRLCRRAGCRHVLVAGFAGERTDHVLAALHYALSARGVQCTFVSEEAILLPLRGRVTRELRVPAGHTVSWFGFPAAVKCSLSGVKWPFRNRLLRADGFHSLSNRPVLPVVHLQQRSGHSVLAISLKPQVNPKLSAARR